MLCLWNLENVGECCEAQWVCVHQRISLSKSYLLLLLLTDNRWPEDHYHWHHCPGDGTWVPSAIGQHNLTNRIWVRCKPRRCQGCVWPSCFAGDGKSWCGAHPYSSVGQSHPCRSLCSTHVLFWCARWVTPFPVVGCPRQMEELHLPKAGMSYGFCMLCLLPRFLFFSFLPSPVHSASLVGTHGRCRN